jgi:GT2 family glycosyltransferase
LVYVDANSPTAIAEELAEICNKYGFTYLREERYLSPNQARNIGLSVIDTQYVAFADNDLFVQPGWLTAMLDCAEATGAWAVTPIVLEGSEHLPVVHMTGCDLIEDTFGGYNRILQRHRNMFQTLAAVRNDLVREPVGGFEFHCVLLRTDVFSQKCFLDERLLSLQEHMDVSREIRNRGGEVYLEPGSVVRYDNATAYQGYDREFFELRWSEEWAKQSIEHTRSKWGLAPDDAALRRLANWTRKHRTLFTRSQTPWALHVAPIVARKKVASWLRRHKLMAERELH